MLQDLSALTGSENVPWAGWGVGGPKAGAYPGIREVTVTMTRVLRDIGTPEGPQEARDLMATHAGLRMPEGFNPGMLEKEWLGD